MTTGIAAFVFLFISRLVHGWFDIVGAKNACFLSLGFICFFLSSGCLTDIRQSIHVKLCRWSENYVWVFYMVVGCVRLEWKNELLSSSSFFNPGREEVRSRLISLIIAFQKSFSFKQSIWIILKVAGAASKLAIN